MLPGKIPPGLLESVVLTRLGATDEDVILGPGTGRDAALVRVGNRLLVMSCDPITGSINDAGWLAVHVNANDIATFGISPSWFLASIMLPTGSSSDDLERIMGQINNACRDLGIAVVGGHTEVSHCVSRPIVSGFMVGVVHDGRYVTSSGARPGDRIVVTKSVGIEGTAILATDGREYLSKFMTPEQLDEAASLRNRISVVHDGVTAFRTGHVTAMHDPTEGGLAGALHEICDASRVGFRVDTSRIPVHPLTRRICDILRLDVLGLISSGCMLIAVKPDHVTDVVSALWEIGIPAAEIGEITGHIAERTVLTNEGEVHLPRPETDALWEGLRRVGVE
ncbi:MAG: AIR synthase family protein [Candidatus Thorarchaeota archaeon]